MSTLSPFLRALLPITALFAFATAPASAAPSAAPIPPDGGKAIVFPFPAKAPVVVQLNGIGATRERLTAMLKNALPNDVEQIDKQIDAGLKELLADRKLTAIPKEGRVFIVVNDIASLFDGVPTISVLVPVTSYKEFRESFLTPDEQKTFEPGQAKVDEVKITFNGEEHAVFMVDLKEYVALSPDKTTAESYAGRYTKATTAAMPPELAKSFVISDLALYVNMDVINDLYGDQIKAFKGLIDFGIQQAQMGGMLPGLNKKQLEAAKTMLHGLFQGIEDCRGLVIAAEFRPDGLNLRFQAQFAEDTESFQLLKSETPSALTELGKLPAGLGQYSGSKYGKKFVELMRGLNSEFAPADDDEKGNELVDKQLKELLAAGRTSEITGSASPDVTFTLSTYAEPKKAASALVGCYKSMTAGGRIQSVVLKNDPKITAGARKHRGFTFDEVNLSFDYEATVRDLPDELKQTTLAQIKRLVPEKYTVWVGTDGKSVIQVGAKDWDRAVGMIDMYLDGKKLIADTPGYKLTRKNLPTDASVLMLMETGQTLEILIEAMRELEGTIPDFPKIGKVKLPQGEPNFIGLSLTLKGDTATANLFVPGSSIAVIRKVFLDLFQNID
ncbi:MAG: hypothetical protein L0241_02950 [Planctomycetia bacterium]|nr:hypothetical protein [Planctomycetia bacterium]